MNNARKPQNLTSKVLTAASSFDYDNLLQYLRQLRNEDATKREEEKEKE